MSLQTRLSDFITAVGTDYKQLRTWITGSSTGTLTGLTTTDKTSLVGAVNEVDAKVPPAPADASETTAGIIEIATQVETDAGTLDTHAITPLKLSSALSSTLSPIATSGSASDLTSGTIPTSVLPPLAINDVFEAASQVAMLALTAQRGDVAIRTDVNRSYILAADDATLLANWKQVTAGGDVLSVAGRTGTVTLTSTDVGLGNVDNTSDVNKPVSTAQASADALRLLASDNLSDLPNKATARTNLAVYSTTQLGNPETDLAALYATAKA